MAGDGGSRERGNPIGPTARTVGENVSRFRSQLGFTQADLSRRLSENGRPIPVASIGRIDSGDRRVDVDDLMALSVALAVTPVALLLPATRSPQDRVELSGWGEVSAGWAWGYALGTRDLVDVVFTGDDGRARWDLPLAARSFPLWAEEEVRRFYGLDQAEG